MGLPPLRSRREDIPLLAEAFLKRIAAERGQEPKRLSAEGLEVAMHYDWPGNVRELENALEHAIVLTDGPEVKVGALPERVKTRKSEPLVAVRTPANPTLETVEQAYIMWVLQAEGGNKSRAAEVLGIDPSTLYRKLARYDADEA
jgi:DNA-binding NtrC family response regulator